MGVCGQDYRLVTPVNADIWKINITIISEWSNQSVHIRLIEVVGDYPYNYHEQTDMPAVSSKAEANLVAFLNTSKTYEIWVRDGYARAFTGVIEEEWQPYILNGGMDGSGYPIYGWTTMGHIGHGISSTTLNHSLVIGLQQELDHGSYAMQEFYLDRSDLLLSFWYRPYPEDTQIKFQVTFDDIIIYEDTFEGENEDYEWRKKWLFLEPFFKEHHLSKGLHNKIPSPKTKSSSCLG